MKKLCILSVICCVFLYFSSLVLATEYPKPAAWVNDYAEILRHEHKEELNAMLQEFEQTTSTQIFVAIMNKLPENTSLEAYVNELFTEWQIGQADKDNGVLLAIFLNDRKLRIEVGYGLEEYLPDATCKVIIDYEITPYFKQRNYYQGIKNGITSMIAATQNVYNADAKSRAANPSYWKKVTQFFYDVYELFYYFDSEQWLMVAVFVGMMIFALFSKNKSSQRKYKYPHETSGGSSNAYSSSHSDSHTHNDFTGGGGGSSGGGGASGSW